MSLGISATFWTRKQNEETATDAWYLHEGDSAEIDSFLKECFFLSAA